MGSRSKTSREGDFGNLRGRPECVLPDWRRARGRQKFGAFRRQGRRAALCETLYGFSQKDHMSMGERGPLPKPFVRRRNRRQTSGKSVTVSRPPMPRDLPAEAKAEWRRIVGELEAAGLLASIDRAVLIRYCTAWSDWVELQRLLERSGKLLKGARGHLVRNPLWFMKQNAEETLAELGRQLCLTPMARLRAGIAHERPPEPGESAGLLAIEEYRRKLQE
jgi:P27 family predicted phage terminase small subunit